MKNYWDGSICKNGHIIDYGKGDNAKHCYKCGSTILTTCTTCLSKIRGAKKISGGSPDYFLEPKKMHMDLPNYCYECGQPYEWTKKVLLNAKEIIELDDKIEEKVKKILNDCIPDLLTETPNTSLAITKYQINIEKVSEPIAQGLTRLLKDFVSESVKKTLF